MNKKLTVLSIGLLSLISLASCSESAVACSQDDIFSQVGQYSLSEVQSNYSRVSVTTDITITTDISELASAIDAGGYPSGETQSTTSSSTTIAIVGEDDINDIAETFVDIIDELEYYLVGTAIEISCDYSGSYSFELWSYAYEGSGDVDYEFTTYEDGRYKHSLMDIDFSSDEGNITFVSESTYTYTAA